jgi:hypothetical protein
MDIGPANIKRSACVLVGTHMISHCSVKTKYPVLNLSLNDPENYSYNNSFQDGRKVVRTHDEYETPTTSPKDLFTYIGKISGLTTKNGLILHIVEYKPQLLSLTNKREIFLDVVAFVSQILEIRQKSNIAIVILPPINRFNAGDTEEQYLAQTAKINICQAVLTLVASKVFLPIIPLHGEITSHGLHDVTLGPWSVHNDHHREPLHNINGVITRELRRRVGQVTDTAVEAWAATIRMVPHLKEQYLQSIKNGYSQFAGLNDMHYEFTN